MPEEIYEYYEPDEAASLERIEMDFVLLEGKEQESIDLKGDTFVVNDKLFRFKNSVLTRKEGNLYQLVLSDVDMVHYRKENGEFASPVAAPDVYDGEWQQFMLYANEGTDVTGIESIRMYCSDGSWADANTEFLEEIGEKLLLVYR